MVIGQIFTAETVNALNRINPLGLVAMGVVALVWVYRLWLNSRNRDRDARTKIKLAEQANLKEKQEGEREERLGFFQALRDIRDYTGAVRDLVQKTTEKDAKADTRDDAMVKALNSITDRLNGLGDNYTVLAINERAIADDLHKARELLEKIPIIEDDLKKALEILMRVDTALQTPITKHGTLPTNNDQ